MRKYHEELLYKRSGANRYRVRYRVRFCGDIGLRVCCIDVILEEENQMAKSGTSLLLNSARGIYIPQNFVECFDADEWHLSQHDVNELSDPNNEFYWDAWNSVLDTAYFVDEEGNKWTLFQDGDLWAICFELMTEEELDNFGFND